MQRITFSVFILSFVASLHAQELSRRASWGARLRALPDQPGALISFIEPGSPLLQAGLLENDIVLQVQGQSILSDEMLTTVTYGLRASTPIELLIRRELEVFSTSVQLRELEKEKHVGLEVFYEDITSDYGIRQRVIITKPEGVDSPQPAIFLLQGLSCSSIENYPGRGSNWAKQIEYIVEKSGMVVVRVEKPGVGDSEGDCASTDFVTELEGYRAAIRLMKQKDYVDKSNIVVYGSSMGSALAPMLVNEFGLAGVISDGTFFKTWYEHMLEIERRIRQMSGDDESTIVKKMNEVFIPLYYGMLIEKKSYTEVIREYPAIADYNYHPGGHMYGRPVAYYHQLQDLDLAGEWGKVKVPIRIMYGTNDWIMSEFDNHMIMKVLDRAGHQDHELLIVPGLDHWNTIHDKPEDSFTGKEGIWDLGVPQQIVDWAREMVGK